MLSCLPFVYYTELLLYGGVLAAGKKCPIKYFCCAVLLLQHQNLASAISSRHCARRAPSLHRFFLTISNLFEASRGFRWVESLLVFLFLFIENSTFVIVKYGYLPELEAKTKPTKDYWEVLGSFCLWMTNIFDFPEFRPNMETPLWYIL